MISAPSQSRASVCEINGRERIAIIDPSGERGWNAFVLGHPDGMIFHRSEWARVLIDTYGYEPRYHVLYSSANEILAAWPAMLVKSRLTGRRLVTLPFSDRCPPLISSAQDGETLWTSVKSDAQELGAGRVELRGWPARLAMPHSLRATHGYLYHTVDLTVGRDALFKRISENARRSIKRGAQLGVSTRVAESAADLERFCELNLKLRRQHGMLPQPRRFFEAIHRHIIEGGLGYILLAERQSQALAALLLMRHGNVTLDKYAVNDAELREFRGSHCVMWRAIEMEIEHGAHWYDMGRSDAAAESLHRFKSQWRGVGQEAPYYYYPAPGGMNTEDPKGRKQLVLKNFCRVSPNPLFRLAGNLAYRHLG